MPIDQYLGTWELVPELSLYEAATPPASGQYTIAESAPGVLTLHVRWQTEPDGPVREVTFGGKADGIPHPVPTLPDAPTHGPDAHTLTRVDAHTLDSTALAGGVVIASARRVASKDGALLAVVQEQTDATGRRTRNFQVYRRVATEFADTDAPVP